MGLLSGTVLVIAAAATYSADPANAQQTVTASSAKPVFHDDFEREMPTGWDFTDPSAWRITTLESGKNKVLELVSGQQVRALGPLSVQHRAGQES